MAIRNPCGAMRRPAPAGPERCGLPRSLARPRNDRGGRWLVPFRRRYGDYPRSYCGTVDARSLHSCKRECSRATMKNGLPPRAEVHFLISIIPKGYHNLPNGQTSLCVSKTSYFPMEMHHFPVRENITGICESSFRKSLRAAFCYSYRNIKSISTFPLMPGTVPSSVYCQKSTW